MGYRRRLLLAVNNREQIRCRPVVRRHAPSRPVPWVYTFKVVSTLAWP